MRGRKTSLSGDKWRKDFYLPTELWREVLARLPAKSLLRFRCVCKSWCSIIDSPEFTHLHLTCFKNNCEKTNLLAIEILKSGTGVLTVRSSDTYRKSGERIRIYQLREYVVHNSINGLLLVSELFYPNLRLWNPSIRKCLLLPPCPFRFIHCAVGFVPCNNDYKVVAFNFAVLVGVDSKPSIAVYSLSDHLWRITEVPNWLCAQKMYIHGHLFAEGVGYWILCEMNQSSNIMRDTRVLAFDFAVEEFAYMELPVFCGDVIYFLFILGKSLAVLGISPVSIYIWVMENERGKKSWSKWFSGDSSLDGYNLFRGCRGGFSENIFYIEKMGSFLVNVKGSLNSYNIITRQIQHVGNPIRCHLGYVDTYVESLLLYKGSEGQTLTSLP